MVMLLLLVVWRWRWKVEGGSGDDVGGVVVVV